MTLLKIIRRPWIILSILWVLGLLWTNQLHLEPQNPWRWETAIHHVPHSVSDLFVTSKVEGRIAIDADGWETLYLPPDTSTANPTVGLSVWANTRNSSPRQISSHPEIRFFAFNKVRYFFLFKTLSVTTSAVLIRALTADPSE